MPTTEFLNNLRRDAALAMKEPKPLTLAQAQEAVQAGHVPTLNLSFTRSFLFDGAAGFMLPADFTQLSTKEAARKYMTPDRPQVILANSDRSVRLLFSRALFPYTDEQVGQVFEKYATVFPKLLRSVRIYKNGVFDLQGRRVEFLEFFSTTVTDTDIFHDWFQFSLDGMNFMCVFSCKSGQARQWRNIFQAIIRTLEIPDRAVE